jgi:non-canonical (house-cleaning) NTP pyrophosphatase
MKTIFVAVGSTRAPKLAAVAKALDSLGPLLNADAKFEIVGTGVASGVAHTPLSRAELMAGARGRCAALCELAAQKREPWEYFVGLEGGVSIEKADGMRLAFVENWACVADNTGRLSYGHSGGILLPEELAVEVIDRGTELAAAIDAYAHGHGIRDAQGTWGVLTRDLVDRQDSFRFAVINAFAPFYNPTLYPRR